MRPVPGSELAVLGDYRRYPGCRLLIACAGCGGGKDYSPERVIARLHQLKSGGYPTPLAEVAQRVKPCARCRKDLWRAQFIWPDNLDARELRRLANLQRS
jgi:hypothetical protein